MKHMASEKRNSKSSGSSRKSSRGWSFVLCVRNEGYSTSLERRKLYPVLKDESAAEHNLVRVVDESEEDYLYPADYFVTLRLPANIKHALTKAS